MSCIILIQALLMLSLKGTNGQEIVFDPMRLMSPCSRGLRSGTDTFILTGTVGRNYSALVSSSWFTLVTVFVSSSKLTQLCDIIIGLGAIFCNSTSRRACYCDHINTTTGSAHIVVNYTAREDFSGGVIQAQWKHQNGTVVHFPSGVTLPTIYDVNNASMTIKVNKEPTRPISARFEVDVVSKQQNTLQLCCTNTASPCYPRLLLNGRVLENQTGDCVSFTVFPPDNYTAVVTSLYSVCSTSDYIEAGSGVIISVEQPNVGTTTVKSPTTGTGAGTTASTLRTETPVHASTPRPVLRTTGMRFERADHTNLLTKFGPGLLLAGLSLVLTVFYAFWASKGASFNRKPIVASVDTTNVGEAFDKHPEAENAVESKDEDTCKQEQMSIKMSAQQI